MTGLWFAARNASGSKSRNNLMMWGFQAHHKLPDSSVS